MERADFEKFKRSYGLKTLVQEAQFEQWLKYFFYLNDELSRKHEVVYQDAFYIKLYELLTEGLQYAKHILVYMSEEVNREEFLWYTTLINGLSGLRSEFTEDEFLFVEYKRHSASHIFQNKYEVDVRKNGSLKTTDGAGKDLDIINHKFIKILKKHGSDINFDIYVTKKLYTKITTLYQELLQK